MARPVRFEASRTLAASPEQIWPFVADTERINHATGLPPVTYAPSARPGGGSTTIAEYRLGPLTVVRWTEDPFQWQAPRFYDVERRFHWGPIASFHGGMELIPTEVGGTSVRVWVDLVPRHGPLGWLAVRVIGPSGISRGLAQVDRIGRYLAGELDAPFPTLERGDTHESAQAIAQRLASAPWDKLPGGQELRARVRWHLEHAPDPDVLNMRPLVLADAWQTDRLDVLSLFLHAAQVGIVAMHWDVLCPHCRIAKARYTSLAQLQPKAFCAGCATAYESDFDRNVELRFDVAPALRRVQANTYCEAGPMSTPHRLARRTVAPNAIVPLQADLERGRYRVVSRQSQGSVEVEAGAQSSAALTTRVVSVYAHRMGPDALAVTPGQTTLSVASHLDVPATIDIEQAEWPDTIATAALVSTLGTFRELFSTEVLAAGQQVAIGRLTFLAVGVADAAALYAALGQGHAFTLIEACLRTTASIVTAHHGAISGTLGERFLATFSAPVDALGAALSAQRAVATLGSDAGVDTTRVVHMGLHEGACVAATVADRLGYFGTSPSTALGLLDAAAGGDILLTADVEADALVTERLIDENLLEPSELIRVSDRSVPAKRIRAVHRGGGSGTLRAAS